MKIFSKNFVSFPRLSALHRMARITLQIFVILILLGGIMAHSPFTSAQAAPLSMTISVNTTADENNTGPGTCSLREAITAANTDLPYGGCPAGTSGADVINLSPGIYQLTLTNAGGVNEDNNATGDLDINDSLTIQGAGAAGTIIQAGTNNSNGIDKVIAANPTCASGVNITIDRVTVRYGYNSQPLDFVYYSHTGGGIDWCGGGGGETFTLSNSIVSDNTNLNAYGAGLNVDSLIGTTIVNITNDTFQNNRTLSAVNEANGGAINIKGDQPTITITNSVFSNNLTTNPNSAGGAIYFNPSALTAGPTSSLTISGSTFTSNTAAGVGGAVATNTWGAGTTVDIQNSQFVTNHATASFGGALYLDSTVTTTVPFLLSHLTLTGNTAGISGGGVYVGNSKVTMSKSLIVGNTATNGSGLYKSSAVPPATASVANNWWGCSNGPAGAGACDSAAAAGGGTLTISPWYRDRLTASPSPIAVNQSTALTASFLTDSSGGGPVPLADISEIIGRGVAWAATNGTLSGTQSSVQAAGTATGNFQATTAGTAIISAKVDNDNTAPTSSNVLSLTVNKANTTTVIGTDLPDPSVTNQSVTVTYTVTGAFGNSPTAPTGNVTVSDGTDSCVGTAAAGSCNIIFSSAGSKTLTATYAGDANFNGSASAGVSHTVNPANTTTVITSDVPDPSVTGQPVPVNYTVTGAFGNSPTAPTGNVTVSDGTNSCIGTAAAGTCNITFTSVGSKTLTATYAGDANFNGSASASAPHTVNPANTTTTITSDTPDPSVVGELVTFNYAVAVTAPGAGTPIGNVTVTDGTNSCTDTVAAGSCTITFTAPSSSSFTATYTSGDANFNGSASASAPHTVNKADTTTAITSDTPDPSLVLGAVTVNFTVAVTAPGAGTLTGNVTVSDGVDSCIGTVASGTCNITLTTVGARTLTATYAGDGNFNTSVSVGDSHTVNQPDTTVTSLTRQSANPNKNATVTWQIVFADPIDGLTASNFSLVQIGVAGASIGSVTETSGPPSTTWNVTATTGTGDGTLELRMANDASLTHNVTNQPYTEPASGAVYTIDKTAPVANNFNRSIPAGTPTNADTLTLQVIFSEDVTGVDADGSDFTVPALTGETISVSPVSASVYDVTISGGDLPNFNGLVDLDFNSPTIVDLAGNALSNTIVGFDQHYVMDNAGPTVTIVVADTALKIGDTSLLTFTFSEAVTGFTNADLTIANGNLSAVSSGDGGITWTATLTPTASIEAPTNVITLDNTGVQDALGNIGSGTTDSNNYAIDTLRPTAAIVVTDTALKIGDTSLVTFTFSEAITGFTNADLTIANGNLTAVSSGDGGVTWTATLTPTASIEDSTNLITLDNTGLVDLAGNAGSGSTDSNNYAIDTIAPTVTINQKTSVPAQVDPTSVSPINFTVVFSESVGFSFATGDVDLSASAAPGTLTDTVTEVAPMDGTTYNVAVSGMTGDGTVIASILAGKAQDLVGNDNAASTSADNSVLYDTVPPSVTINQKTSAPAQADPTSASPINFTVVFSEAVTDFETIDLADVDLSLSTAPGALAFTITEVAPMNGTTYTVAVSGMTGPGTVIANIPAGVAIDGGGNPNSIGTFTDHSVTYDATAPTVINVTSTKADGTYGSGTLILVTVQFSENVTVTGGSSSAPTLQLETGSVDEIIGWDTLGSGTDTLAFTYIVQPGNTTPDLNYLATNSLALAGSAIKDAAGNNADLTLPALAGANSIAGQKAIVIDAVGPVVTGVTSSKVDGAYAASTVISIQVTFDESVLVTPTPQLTLETGATDRVVNYASGSGSATLTFDYTVQAGDESTDLNYLNTTALALNGGSIKDAIGNIADLTLPALASPASLGGSKALVIDAVAPSTTITSTNGLGVPPGPGFTSNANSATFDFTGNDGAGVGGLTFQCKLDTGSYTSCTSPQNYGSLADGSHTFYVYAADSLGNADASPATHTWTVDTVKPGVVVSSITASPTNTSPITITITFSEPVTGFTPSTASGDIVLGGVGGVDSNPQAVSSTVYTFDLAPSAQGAVTVTVPAGSAVDSAANPNTVSNVFSITYDTVAPTVTINQASGQLDPTTVSPINFTVVFNEAVTGFATGDVNLSASTTSGTLTGAVTETAPMNGTTYNVAVSGMTSVGTVIASIPASVAQDAAGNNSAASTSADNTVVFTEGVPPDTTINSQPANPSASASATFTFSGTDNVTPAASLTFECALDGGGFSACATPKNYPALADGSHTFQVRAIDGALNVDASPASYTWTIDTIAPAVTINQALAQTDPTTVSPINFTVVFNETVTGFTNADVTLSGTAGATTVVVTGSGPTYNVAVSGMTSVGTVIASIPAGAAQDAAGNNSAASSSADNSVTFADNGAPDTTINSQPANPSASANAAFTFSGTDNFTPAASLTFECNLDGAGFSPCTSPKNYAALADGSHTFLVRAKDGAGNVDASPASYTWTVDTIAPTVTINQAAAQPDPTSASPINFTVTFNESVTGFTNADVTLSGTAGATTAVVTGSGATYNIAVSGMTASGTVIAAIPASAAQDAAGNNSAASTSTDNTVNYIFAVPPVITEGVSVNVTMTENGVPTPFALTLNATDANSDPLTWSILTNAVYGTTSVAAGPAASAAVSYVPLPNYYGTDSFVVQVSDGNGGTDSIIVNVTLTPEPYGGTLIWNQSYAIKYDTWFGVEDTSAFGGGYRQAEKGTFTFKPKGSFTRVKWITYRGPDQGKAQVLVDGVVKKTIDLYSATPEWQYAVTISGLTNAKHTVVVKALNAKNAASTGKWVVVDDFRVGATDYDDFRITYGNLFAYGSWKGFETAGPRFGRYRISSAKNASLSLSFDGTQLTWTTARGPAYGKASIYVDGVLVKTVDLYKASQQWMYLVTVDGLTYGPHNVVIKVLGTKNPASTGTGVVCDGFEVE